MISKNISRGVTLVEMLVVIFIIVILMAITIPAVSASREMARRASCLNNLHQIGIGIQGYASTYGVFPAARNGLDYSPLVQILPYNGQTALYDAFDRAVPEAVRARHPERYPSSGWSAKVSSLLCPSDPYAWSAGDVTSYAGNEGDGTLRRGLTTGFFSDGPYPRLENHLSPAEFTDGLSHTVAFSEWLVGQASPLPPIGSSTTPGDGNPGATTVPRERGIYALAEGVLGPPWPTRNSSIAAGPCGAWCRKMGSRRGRCGSCLGR
jgi:prepilin-type N-terminal cleavage/methylation domain-containing protein